MSSSMWNAMSGPSPPRCLPGPPESGASSKRLHQPGVLRLPDLDRREARRRLDVMQRGCCAVAVDRWRPARPGAASRRPRSSPVSSRTPHHMMARESRRPSTRRPPLGHRLRDRVVAPPRSPASPASRRGSTARARARGTSSPGRVIDLDRPEVALVRRLAAAREHRITITRAADTVDAIGQLTGPGRASGAPQKSSRAVVPSTSSTTSNGIGSSVIPSSSISPRPT